MKRFVLLSLFATIGACSKDPDAKTPADDESVATVDCEIDLGTQPTERFPVGDVLWLPMETEECGALQWSASTLSSGQGFLVGEEPRFVPLQPGTYVLEEENTGISVEVTAIDPASIPFHNLMYQPNDSMLHVDDEVWVAEAHAPRIATFDAQTGEQLGAIAVGPWPVSLAHVPSMNVVVVAQTGNDTLGVIDVANQHLSNVIWVGDEPSNVVVDDDAGLAYVALETESAVAVVDLAQGVVSGRLDAPRSPQAMALTEDGATLIVAGHRTGQPDRYPYEEDEASQVDVQAIDVASGEVLWQIEEAGNIIADVVLDDASDSLWVATTVAFPERGLVTLDSPPFESQVQEYDLANGEWLRSTTLGPAAEGEGFVLGIQDILAGENQLWAIAQDTEVVVQFDKTSMDELARTSVQGGPRTAIWVDDAVWIHAAQSHEVHRMMDAELTDSLPILDDPRPEEIVEGHGHYIRPGETYGQNFSCNSCHYDGQGDTQVWRAGPFETWELSRPMMWLEGTAPLGWGGYVDSSRAFGYTGFTSIIAVWPTTEMAEELGAFLSSLAPPPKANGHTERDGQLSAEALVGKALYEGDAGCVACHGGPLTTNNQSFENGITEERTNTPTLVGAYRHNAWLKDGSAKTLREAIVAAAEWSGASGLTDAEVDSLERYLMEMTDRDFFLMHHHPESTDVVVGVDEPIVLTFNQSVWTGDDNLEKIQLLDSQGAMVDASVDVDNRTIVVRPSRQLDRASTYTLEVSSGFASFNERTTEEDIRFDVTTAESPGVWFDGRYTLNVDLPAFDFEANDLNPDVTLPLSNAFVAAPTVSGSSISMDLKDGLTWDTTAVIEGTSFSMPAIPVKAGNSLAQGSAIVGEAEDVDSDGIVDQASGTFTVSGPGFYAEDVVWEIVTEQTAAGDCVPGASGSVDVMVEVDGDDIVIDWGDAEALGLYVTTYGATLPLGPGATVSGGDAFWAISTEAFPAGFVGPVVYGALPDAAIDESEANGAPVGGADLESGECYEFSVITTAFQSGSFTLEL